MKRVLLSIIAILFPWMIMLINDDPMGTIIAIILQASIVGWIPASIWAWRVAQTMGKNTSTKKNSSKKA